MPVLGVVPYTARWTSTTRTALRRALEQHADRRRRWTWRWCACRAFPILRILLRWRAIRRWACAMWRRARSLGEPDLVVLPGTKNTMDDLAWMRQNGLEAAVLRSWRPRARRCWACAAAIRCWDGLWTDPDGVEQGGAHGRAWACCPATTRLSRAEGAHPRAGAAPNAAEPALPGAQLDGYEIHMGRTERLGGTPRFCLPGGRHAPKAPVGRAMCSAPIFTACLTTGELTEKLASLAAGVQGRSRADGRARRQSHAATRSSSTTCWRTLVRSSLDMLTMYRDMDGCAAM